MSEVAREWCPNGADSTGTWLCDPEVVVGVADARCQTCGHVAALADWLLDTGLSSAIPETMNLLDRGVTTGRYVGLPDSNRRKRWQA